MATKSKQRLHDALAMKVVVMLVIGGVYGVVHGIREEQWVVLFGALLAASMVALLWVRTSLANEAWRDGYRHAVDDIREGGTLRSTTRG